MGTLFVFSTPSQQSAFAVVTGLGHPTPQMSQGNFLYYIYDGRLNGRKVATVSCKSNQINYFLKSCTVTFYRVIVCGIYVDIETLSNRCALVKNCLQLCNVGGLNLSQRQRRLLDHYVFMSTPQQTLADVANGTRQLIFSAEPVDTQKETEHWKRRLYYSKQQEDTVDNNNNEIEPKRQCCVCKERTKEIVLDPCFHRCLCASCSVIYLEKTGIQRMSCPLCRSKVRKMIAPID